MKKKIFILGACTLLLCGCGKIPKLSNGDDAIVTFKDDDGISVNDFYEQIKNNYGLDVLVDMINKYIYEKEVSDKKDEANTYAEAVIKSFKSSFDDEATALRYLQTYYSAQSFEAYQDKIYLNYMQSEAIEKYVKEQITEDELKDYYENNVYPNMTISHILINPVVTSSMTDNEKESAEEEAKKKIETIIEELNKVKKENGNIEEKFSELAKTYSEDDSNKNDGGSLGEINIGDLDSTYDELIKAAAKLNDGEYSTSLITTEAGYHVILKTKTGDKKSYEDALDTMKDNIANDKLSDTENGNSLMIEAIKAYRDKYNLDIIDSELDSQYGRYMNNLINSN